MFAFWAPFKLYCSIEKSISDADAIFIAVGTPERRGDGHADLTYVYAAAEEIAPILKKYCVLITKSTVPVGTSLEIKNIIKSTMELST